MIGPGDRILGHSSRSNYWSCPLSTGILQYESNLTILYPFHQFKHCPIPHWVDCLQQEKRFFSL